MIAPPMSSGRVTRALLVSFSLLLTSHPAQLMAQAAHNWHTLSNGMDVTYVGIGGGAGQTGGVDGIGSWVDGNDLRGNHLTNLGEFGYRQTSFWTSACVLGAPPAIGLDYPAIAFFEYAGGNNNLQNVFVRPGCSPGGVPLGVTSAGALPYGLAPGTSTSFLITGFPDLDGVPTTLKFLLPNDGLPPTSSFSSTTIIAAGAASLPISSTGFCWDVEFTWLPTTLASLDHIDGWWFWQTNSIHDNQYWAMSNDELNTYTSNTVALIQGGTALATFFSGTELVWHSTTSAPSLNVALNPAGFQGNGSYDSALSTSAINPNGGWDVGRNGGVSLSGLGGVVNPNTGLAAQNPAGSPFGGVPTLGYMSWDNEPTVPGLRTVWHQIDWGGVLGTHPASPMLPDALVGPPGTRLPISITSGLIAGSVWPQAVTAGQWSLMLHTAIQGHAEPNPVGYPAIFDQWASTNQLPISGVAPVCIIGLPLVIDAGSTGVLADLSDFAFGDRMSVSTSVTILD